MNPTVTESKFVKVMHGAPLNRKFIRMGRRLGISRFEAFGLTVALWEWTDRVSPYGEFPPSMTAEDFTDSLGIDHIDPDDLLKTWIEVGLVDSSEGGYQVHGWMEGNRTGASAQWRIDRAERGAHKRWHVKLGIKSSDCRFCDMDDDASEDAPGDASPMLKHAKALLEDASTSTSMSSSTSVVSESVTGEEPEFFDEWDPDDDARPFE